MLKKKKNGDTAMNGETEKYGLYLTKREKDHLAELETSCLYIETKKESTTQEMTDKLREYGYVRIVKENSKSFWCIFSDISNEMTIEKVIT